MSERIFTLSIRMEGAAFGEDEGFTFHAKQEVAALLNDVVEQIGELLKESGSLVDYNGNTVGRFEMKEVDEPTP